jgi:transcriptional regulator with XRE-family HTH domain
MRAESSFAAQLRWWRRRRGWSQLELAGRAGVSQRHLSFLEISRAAPSRDMVIRLATTLDLPLRQHNGLLGWRTTPKMTRPPVRMSAVPLYTSLLQTGLSITTSGPCRFPASARCLLASTL